MLTVAMISMSKKSQVTVVMISSERMMKTMMKGLPMRRLLPSQNHSLSLNQNQNRSQNRNPSLNHSRNLSQLTAPAKYHVPD